MEKMLMGSSKETFGPFIALDNLDIYDSKLLPNMFG
jgi:hypothetical protein